jgi:phospholipid/cholesterol/gamma-HCH transport system permease protein
MPTARIELSQDGQTLHCIGEWTLAGLKHLPAHFPTLGGSAAHLQIDAAQITALDTIGAFRLRQWMVELERAGRKTTITALNKQHALIFQLVDDNFQKLHPPPSAPVESLGFVTLLGGWTVHKWKNALSFLSFIGEVVVQFFRIHLHGARNLWQSGIKIIQTAGCQALPIVGMMSFLVGIVLAYQLGVELQIYGADIYVVDASGIAILREFSPLMTSVIIAGRTSTAFAALIGTMKVNHELDALATMGISAIERLVLPRMAGLIMVLPLLVVWSMLFSILGGMIMAKGQLGIGYITFLQRFSEAVEPKQYILGLVKTPIFAAIIATVGCFQGFRAGITADSVGLRTTAAAVQAIFLIIVADAFFSVLYSWRGL